jgi:glycine cleavage system H lipoate-binding protein
VTFLKWVLTDGQQYLNSSGYNDLVYSELQRKLDKLPDNNISISTSNNKFAKSERILFGIAALSIVVLGLAIFIELVVVEYILHRKKMVREASSVFPLVFDEGSITIPRGLFYDKTHTWAFMEKNGVVRIGIDDFLQHITGPLTRVKMKNNGDKIKKGEQVLSIIQNGKQLNIYAPISGTIKAQNKILTSNSSLLNSSPYSDGWVYIIEPSNWLREIQFLIMEEKYKEWLKSEFSRLKDFLAALLKPDAVEYAHGILQDGGELKDGVLKDLGPEVWEDFQTNFIKTSN